MKKLLYSLFALSSIVLWSCTQTIEEKNYVYELKDITLQQAGANKTNPKTDLEFISVVYSDLYNRTITQDELVKLANIYNSFGDKNVVVDMIVRNMINSPEVSIPSSTAMRADVDLFIRETYKKFYVREPTEYEKWYFRDQITKNANLTPQQIYYSFLTSNEYKFY